MMKKRILIVLVLVLCASTEVAKADFIFGTPTEVPNINTSSEELNASISADGLSLYFVSTRPGGIGGRDIWVASRATTDDDWGEPVNLGPIINTPAGEWGVSISSDGLSLYFDTLQTDGAFANDLWVATRETTDDDWSNPVNLGPIVNSSSGDDYTPSISSDNLSLYFMSNRSGKVGAYDLWVTTRETTDEDWGAPVNLGPPVNSSGFDVYPGISADGLLLFFAFFASAADTRTDLWVTSRATTDDPWGQPVDLGPTVNSSAWDDYPNVSADGSTLFFRRSLSGLNSGGDIWQAPIIPIIDFNADGIVDATDMCIMIDNWGTDNSLCDIGPMPWGDGIVDTQDLIVLSEHLFEEVNDPTLIAHWALDETEGMFAADSVGDNDAIVIGGATWQPDGGQIDGGLQLNGIDGYAVTGPIIDPADGPFSVLAWIKADALGQVIISQQFASNWLATDAEGKLITELKSSDQLAGSLVSETVIIDGQWHRIGFVWDGSNRSLYVDDILVAEDTQNNLSSSLGGLNIGCGSNSTMGSFWSGLIDDIRIYDRAVKP
jgi:Tol biopolymer transport system component